MQLIPESPSIYDTRIGLLAILRQAAPVYDESSDDAGRCVELWHPAVGNGARPSSFRPLLSGGDSSAGSQSQPAHTAAAH